MNWNFDDYISEALTEEEYKKHKKKRIFKNIIEDIILDKYTSKNVYKIICPYCFLDLCYK